LISHLDLAELKLQRRPFNRAGWIHELKYDGFRILVTHASGTVRLLSRRGTAYHDIFPELVADVAQLPYLAIDGELVLLDSDGRPQFGELVRRSRMRKATSIQAASRSRPAAIYAFDLLQLDREDLRPLPLLERKTRLKDALAGAKRIRYVEHIEDGLGLFAAAEEAALEGIVSKKALARYRRGRTGDWIKIKTSAGRALVEDRGTWNER
jgi:bifunctional non-homologous end joining protein LigD